MESLGRVGSPHLCTTRKKERVRSCGPTPAHYLARHSHYTHTSVGPPPPIFLLPPPLFFLLEQLELGPRTHLHPTFGLGGSIIDGINLSDGSAADSVDGASGALRVVGRHH
jgi:hypothetical protein